jgi:V/A-type H+-transporting ATPase subunit A
VIVYVGCGERGNEMTEMLRKLPELRDPRTGRPLSERTILVANTSNMPVPAREASIYTGITMAEYYRDMGYRVLVLADSTSRWAEALREVSGRLGEMPAEEGYPSYLASRLAAFYERAGHVRTLGGRQGSVTIISAISPSGGDVTEPVTRQTQRFTRAFWTLDKAMAEARIFPAINLRDSYSHTPRGVDDWWRAHISEDWPALRQSASDLLDEAEHLEATARLIGTQSLPERQQFLLRAAAVIQEGFLQQNAMDDRDA